MAISPYEMIVEDYLNFLCGLEERRFGSQCTPLTAGLFGTRFLITYPIARPRIRRTTITPYAQPGMEEVVCVTVLVAVVVGPVTVVVGPVTVLVLVDVVVVVNGIVVVTVRVSVVDVEVVEAVGVDDVVEVVVEVAVEVYLKVIVPLAPFESIAVMTYVPDTHAELPPTFVV